MRSSRAVVEERCRVASGALDTLLRAELAACEAYRTAIHSVERGGESPALALRSLYRMHRRFADEIQRLLSASDEEEPEGARAVWTDVARRVAGAPGGLDGATVLKRLQGGERSSLELALGTLRELSGRPAAFVRARYAPGLATNLELLSALLAHHGDEPAADEARP
ncbi:MAG TPA: hypothetical protein PLP50_08245 [Thermoanaerobaculia bacterium]|nr:hypothetical protein [Thermoanaerobaculia bacterium]HQN07698.1 hypothetical protein [Thermoanaerobaculia bacterium]HQP85449.1 hypothetical protein [Thermoanaerobaculia bacterium]